MLSTVVALIALQAPAKPTTLLFVRHGETVANATGVYNSRTLNVLSDRGQEQVRKLTQQLQGMKFDTIIVSPSPRALKSIAPYLKATGRRAEVWPELYECCDGNTRKRPGYSGPKLTFTTKFEVPADIREHFVVVPGRDRLPNSPTYLDGLRQIEATATRFRSTYGNRGITVLVVGHSLHGGRFLELLQGRQMEGKIRPDNAKLMPFVETGNGRYAPKR